MKRMIINQTNVYSEKDLCSSIAKQLPSGKIIELGSISHENNIEWIEAFENLHFIGYIDGNTQLLNIDKYYFITGDILISYEKPDSNSPIVGKYKRDNHIYPIEKLTINGNVWFRIYDNMGKNCYIPENSNIKSCEFSAYNSYVAQKTVCVYTQPQKRNSQVLITLTQGTNVIVSNIVEDEYKNYWLKIITNGKVGYIPRSTQLREGSLPTIELRPSIGFGAPIKEFFTSYLSYLLPALIAISICIVFLIFINIY